MADARITQPSFTAGEISEELYARKDLARYQVGVRKLLNCFVLPTGGVSNRAGTRFAAEVPDSAKNTRLMTFEAAADDAYLLAWGDLVVRPMSFGVYVDNLGTPYEITTPYPHTTLDDIYMEQSNDVASLVHPDYPPRELSRFDTLDWRMSIVDFAPTTLPPEGLTATATEGYTGYGSDKLQQFYTYKVASISAAGEESLPSDAATSDVALVLGFDKNFVTLTWNADGINTLSTQAPIRDATDNVTFFPVTMKLTNNRTVLSVGLYSASALPAASVKIAQRTSANNMTVVVAQTFAHPGGGWHDVTLSSPYVVPGSGDFYLGAFTDAAIDVKRIPPLSRIQKSGNIGLGASAGWTEDTGPTWAVRGEYQAIDGAPSVDNFAVYKESNGAYGFIGNTPTATFKDNNILPSFAQGPQTGYNPFDNDNYPSTVSFAQQRRVFANSVLQPQTLWMTQAGNYSSMAKSSPTRDDDAIEITLAARKKQDIYHIVPLEKGMIVFTRSGEWRVTGRDGDVLTPSSILPEPQTSHGAAKHLKPLIIGEQLLFAPRLGDGVLEMEYSIQIDRYKANDLTVLSRHLFKDKRIVAWAYAKTPDGIIYCVLDDGTALTLTYLKDHEVWGWGRLDTKGKFLDVSVVPEGGRDVPYFIVERRIGGNRKRYIEFLAARNFTDVRDAFFVDCGASLDVPVAISAVTGGATTTITSNAHGLVNGDTVELSGVNLYDADGELIECLDDRWIVAGATANTFRITYEYDNDEADPPVSAGDDHASTGWSYYDGEGVFRKAVMTVTGLDHLEGRTCVALCDGSVIEGVVPGAVTGGIGLTFDRKYARVHVGLSYRSVVTTLDLLNPQGDDTGIVKGAPKWVVRAQDTRGIKIGRTEEEAEELPPRNAENYGDPASMFSGLFPLDTWSDWSTDQPCAIVQDYPLPMTILGVTDEVEYGGTE